MSVSQSLPLSHLTDTRQKHKLRNDHLNPPNRSLYGLPVDMCVVCVCVRACVRASVRACERVGNDEKVEWSVAGYLLI